jgi:hypothetical protein
MTTFNVTSNDTLTIDGRVMVDFADDDVTSITFPTELVTRKTGKNGNTIFAKNAAGENADVTVRLMRGSSDDVFLSKKVASNLGDFTSLVLSKGTFVKRLGDGAGSVKSDTYTLAGGVIAKNVDGKENVSGDTSQGVVIYTIRFASAKRVMG